MWEKNHPNPVDDFSPRVYEQLRQTLLTHTMKEEFFCGTLGGSFLMAATALTLGQIG